MCVCVRVTFPWVIERHLMRWMFSARAALQIEEVNGEDSKREVLCRRTREKEEDQAEENIKARVV